MSLCFGFKQDKNETWEVCFGLGKCVLDLAYLRAPIRRDRLTGTNWEIWSCVETMLIFPIEDKVLKQLKVTGRKNNAGEGE